MCNNFNCSVVLVLLDKNLFGVFSLFKIQSGLLLTTLTRLGLYQIHFSANM